MNQPTFNQSVLIWYRWKEFNYRSREKSKCNGSWNFRVVVWKVSLQEIVGFVIRYSIRSLFFWKLRINLTNVSLYYVCMSDLYYTSLQNLTFRLLPWILCLTMFAADLFLSNLLSNIFVKLELLVDNVFLRHEQFNQTLFQQPKLFFLHTYTQSKCLKTVETLYQYQRWLNFPYI